jgi:hypothetical protein
MKKACPQHSAAASTVESALQAKLLEGAFALERSESILRQMNSLLAKVDVDDVRGETTPMELQPTTR